MTDVLQSDQAPFLAELGPFDEDVLQVVRFEAFERMSRPFELKLELASRQFDLDLDSAVGKDAALTIRTDGGQRYIHGVVAEIESGAATEHHCFYNAIVRPKLWLLSQRENCRIFQEMAVPDIVEQIMDEHGLSAGVDHEFRLSETPPPREYCVQYRESDLAFVSRLLEEEGIFFWIDHTEERAQVVFGNSRSATPNITGDYEVRMAPPGGLVAAEQEEQVFEIRSTQRVRPGAFASTDYAFKEPTTNLLANADAGVDQNLEIFDFPGEYVEPGVGTSLAKVRMEEQQVSRREVGGRSNCTRFQPGMTFDLVEHPRDVLNETYLITELRQTGASPQTLEEDLVTQNEARFSNEFVAIPVDQPFRPARETERPVVRGSQVAVVVGPAGEEIYCDEYGRVRVQFFWDRYAAGDQTSSCWIRVSQAWADAGWGHIAIPRVGQEVLVDFLEGDPDSPVIVGRLYNGDKMPPNTLPDEQSKMTIRSQSLGGSGGSNEITMDDTGGSEHFYEHAQFDFTQVVEHNRVRNVGNNENVDVGNDKADAIGNNKTLSVGTDHTESIGSNMTIQVGCNLSETVAVNYSETVGAAMDLTVGGFMSESIGVSHTQTVGGSKSESVGSDKSIRIGENLKSEIGKDSELEVGKDSKEKVGGKKEVDVAEELSFAAKKIQLVAKDEISLKVGKAQIIMKKNGDITIKGKNIQVKGSGKVSVKGSKIANN